MKRTGLYKNVKLWFFGLIGFCLLLSWHTGLAKNEDIAPEIIYYDYIDEHGILKGGMIKVYADSPLHSRYKDAKQVFRESTQYNVETIIDNGTTENRLDLVFLGDGYQENDLDDYASHVDIVVAGFFAEPPFDEYASFFNVHRVDVISTDEGVKHGYVEGCDDPYDPVTALEMQFCSEWRPGKILEHLLTIGNPAAADAAANQAPDNDSVMALANSTKYGGSGGTYVCLSGGNQWRVDLALHEFGHSFANLGDEYFETGSGSYPGTEEELEANLSTYDRVQMENLNAKWYRWLDAETVPTEHGPIDTREGGRYYELDIYRPTWWSKMRAFVDDDDRPCPFHQVNVEQFVLKIYGYGELEAHDPLDPIDYATPEGTYAIGTKFFVQPVKPATHSLDVTWYRVGDPEPVGTGTEFDSSTLDLPTGEYTLQVKVVDNTEMVKDETARTNYLTEWREWTLGEAANWKFDETEGTEAEDSIGDNNGILGISPYDPAWEDEDPVRGSCLEFDGGDYVSFSTMDALEDSDATISAWINAKNLGTVGTDYYSILSQLNGSNGYELFINGDKPEFRLNDTYSVQSSEAIDEGKWYHLAGTYDGSDLKIYVNGELTSRYVSGLSGVSNTGYIGWLFDGRIDDVRVYDWAMDQAQIWEIMSAGASKFAVKDNYRVNMAWFDDSGNLFLKGSKYTAAEWKEPSGTNDEFIIEKNSGPTVYIDDSGNLYLQGSFTQYPTPVPPATGGDEFRVQVPQGEDVEDVVIIKAANGNVHIKGKLYENPE